MAAAAARWEAAEAVFETSNSVRDAVGPDILSFRALVELIGQIVSQLGDWFNSVAIYALLLARWLRPARRCARPFQEK